MSKPLNYPTSYYTAGGIRTKHSNVYDTCALQRMLGLLLRAIQEQKSKNTCALQKRLAPGPGGGCTIFDQTNKGDTNVSTVIYTMYNAEQIKSRNALTIH